MNMEIDGTSGTAGDEADYIYLFTEEGKKEKPAR